MISPEANSRPACSSIAPLSPGVISKYARQNAGLSGPTRLAPFFGIGTPAAIRPGKPPAARNFFSQA